MESYRIRQTGSGGIDLERKGGRLSPVATKGHFGAAEEDLEPLSLIIAELNERFGLKLGPEHRKILGQIIEKLDDDTALDASARVNTRENIRLTFDHKVTDVVQEIVDTNFELYKRITDDKTFGDALRDFLFDHYLRAHRQGEELIKQGESKTLECQIVPTMEPPGKNLSIKTRPGHGFLHQHDGECPKIQKYALKELKTTIFGNTSPSVYSTHCFFMKSNMLFVIAASGISASL